MRKLLVFATLVIALASFGAQAQYVQYQDPAIVPETEVGEVVFEQGSVTTPIPGHVVVNADTSKRRRAVRSESPFLYRAAVDYRPAHGATSRVFGPLPVFTTVEDRVVKPDGAEIVILGGYIWPDPVPEKWAVMSTPGYGCEFCDLWDKPLPPDWPAGVTKFVSVTNRYGRVYTATNRVAVNMPVVAAADPIFASVYPDGAVKLVGHELVLVVGSEKVGYLELEAGNYIPAGQIKNFPVTLTGCWDVTPPISGFGSLPTERTDLECSTVVVNK